MRRAEKDDKPIVVDILANSFKDNKSVNYIVPHAGSRKKRLLRLMEYSFDYCMLFGEIYLSDDKKACALVVFPDKKNQFYEHYVGFQTCLVMYRHIQFAECLKKRIQNKNLAT